MIKNWYILLFILSFVNVSGQEISVSGGYGQLIPHHARMNYLVTGHAQNIQLNYSERNSKHQSLTYHGGVMFTGNPKVLGNVYYAYTSLDNKLGKRKLGEFSIGLGVSYATKTFDPNTNNKDIAIGSHINSAIEFAYYRTIVNKDNFHWSIGTAFKHFSNGSYQTPNLGLNFLTINTSFSFHLSDKIPDLPYYKDTSSKLEKVIYSSIGIHENPSPERGKYPLVTLGFGLTKKIKNQLRPIVGVDAFYNPANSNFYVDSSGISPFQSGFFIGNTFDLSLVKVGVQMGVYTFNQFNLKGMIYHKFVVDRQINKNLSVLLILKSHWAVAESFMIGLGYKF